MPATIEEIKGAVKDAVQPISQKMDDFEARMKKIEDAPVFKAPTIITTPREFLGRNLSKMGARLRNLDAKEFPAFANEERMDGFMKGLLSIVHRKGLSAGTDANGGYMVPDEYAMDLVKLARNSSYALKVCRQITMGSDTLKIPTEAGHGTATWVGESSQKTASEPTFGQVTLTAKKLVNLAVASNELIADSEVDIGSILAEQFAYTQGMELDNQVFNGTGDPVSGVLTAKAGYSVVINGTGYSGVTAVDISSMIAKIEEGRLANARFFFGRLGAHYIRTLKDSNNRPIYQEIVGPNGRALYEYPVNMSEKLPTADGDATAFGVFGDFNYFIIGRRAASMVIEADPYSRFDYYDTRFRMVTRWGMAVADANAFCRIMS